MTINPGRFLALVVSVLSLLSLGGCGPEEPSDKQPPDYTIAKADPSHGKYRFGVTDTLSIGFNEKIDTAALALSFSPSQGIETRWQSLTRLFVFGKNKSSGATHFTVNSPFTATLAGLKDMEGNGRSAISLDFQPYWWSDRDFTDTLYNGFDSLFATDSTWGDGSAFADSLVTEGSLDFNNNIGREDRQDIKLIKLVPPDTFNITASCPKGVNLRVQIAGPFPPTQAGLDSVAKYNFAGSFHADTAKTKFVLTYGFSARYEDHDNLLRSASAPALYAIRLSIPGDQEGFYRLGLGLHRKKRI